MTSTIRMVFAVLTAVVVGLPATAAAQARTITDPNAAKRGAVVWGNNGCYMCHAFGIRLNGPDLNGVLERRDRAWLKSWMKDPYGMLLSDPQAQAMFEEYHRIKMPNYKLSDKDIDALLHYFAQETAKAKRG